MITKKKSYGTDSSLNDKVAKRSISVSFNLESSSEVRSHPLFLSQDQASFAEVTGLKDMAICTSRSAQVKKPQGFWADMLFGLLLELWEEVWEPVFCLEELPIVSGLEGDQECEWKESKGNKDSVESGAGVPQQG